MEEIPPVSLILVCLDHNSNNQVLRMCFEAKVLLFRFRGQASPSKVHFLWANSPRNLFKGAPIFRFHVRFFGGSRAQLKWGARPLVSSISSQHQVKGGRSMRCTFQIKTSIGRRLPKPKISSEKKAGTIVLSFLVCVCVPCADWWNKGSSHVKHMNYSPLTISFNLWGFVVVVVVVVYIWICK